jgi:predicted TPR repeat methyltransferase
MEPTDENRKAWDELHRRHTEAMPGNLGLPEPVRRSLGDLKGKRVLHLQCATGESTVALAELGALVTGVDVSGEALAAARERSESIHWVQADVQALPGELRRGRFDLVYSAQGGLPWLRDLTAWAGGIASALRAGGDFLLFEEHPVAICVDPMLHWREDYFDASVWRLGQVVTTLAQAGLTIRALEEYPGTTSSRHNDRRVPGTFLLHARQPG